MATKKAKVVKAKKKYPKFVFTVVKWDETGNKLLFKKIVNVRRATQRTAKEFLIKKYPRPYFFELYFIEK